MRKTRLIALASVSLACLAPATAAAAPNVLYTASGTFATTIVSGSDLLKLAGQPFSIGILANESLKPTTHTKTSATYTNVDLMGTLQSGLAPGTAIPISSAGATLTLQIGTAGGPDQASVQFTVAALGATETISGMVSMPPGTLTTLAIRPFTAPVAFTGTNGSATYTCNIGCTTPTTLAIASGSVNGALAGVTTLYSFTGQNGDGANPYAGLILGKHGEFYSTTYYGGSANSGTAFELTPPASPGGAWTETVLYSFSGGSDGQYPQGSLVLSPSGALYGTTFNGGTSGDGTVFELTPPATAGGAWTEKVLHSFQNQNGDGYAPRCSLVIGHGGVLYGTTSSGGSSNLGTVFALAPPASPGGPWKEKVLHSFTGPSGDGATPLAGLVMSGDGSLYGTTWAGGLPIPHGLVTGDGIVFELTPPAAPGGAWTETVLYEFTGQNGDGKAPYSGVMLGPNGSLYGTTGYGGDANIGAVFELRPPATPGGAWTESTLHSFTGQNGDGIGPYASLVMDASGALYSTTGLGGATYGGIVFKLTPPSAPGAGWTESLLATLIGSEGTEPIGNLIFGPNGKLYGTAEFGGNAGCSNSNQCGTVFALQP